MDEQEKPFDAVSIVLLMTIAGFSDAADLATVLLFPIPVIGQVIYLGNSFLVSPITWAIIQGWFIMKTSGGRMSLGSFTSFIPVLGGLGNIANIPGSEMITTAIAIAMANHPKVAALAVVAGAAVATGGAGAAAAGASGGTAGAATTGAVAAETGVGAVATGAEAAAGAETGAAAGRVAAGAEEAGGAVKTEATGRARGLEEPGERAPEAESVREQISDEALGEEKSPFEKLRELTEKTPDSGQRKDRGEDEEQSVNVDDDANEVDLKKRHENNINQRIL